MFKMNIENRDYFAANAPSHLKDLFFVTYKMPTKCPPDKIGKRGTDMRFDSIESALKNGLRGSEIINYNQSVIDEWVLERTRIEEILWRYNYADYMLKYGKTDLTPREDKALLKG